MSMGAGYLLASPLSMGVSHEHRPCLLHHRIETGTEDRGCPMGHRAGNQPRAFMDSVLPSPSLMTFSQGWLFVFDPSINHLVALDAKTLILFAGKTMDKGRLIDRFNGHRAGTLTPIGCLSQPTSLPQAEA